MHLLPGFKAALADPKLTEFRTDLALLDSRLGELLRKIAHQDSTELWTQLRSAFGKAQKATHDPQARTSAMSELETLIDVGIDDGHVWNDILNVLEHRRRIIDSEQKRLTNMGQWMTLEQGLAIVAVLVDAVHKHVADRGILAAIQSEIQPLLDQQPKMLAEVNA